jgi:hypothetical protein
MPQEALGIQTGIRHYAISLEHPFGERCLARRGGGEMFTPHNPPDDPPWRVRAAEGFQAFKERNSAEKGPEVKDPSECLVCTANLAQSGPDRSRFYCSVSCRRRASRWGNTERFIEWLRREVNDPLTVGPRRVRFKEHAALLERALAADKERAREGVRS